MLFNRGFFNTYKDVTSKLMVNESFQRTKSFSSSSHKFASGTTVFISHSHDELDLGELDGFIGLLRRYNVVPYIDSMDKNMPSVTCADTAKRIKEVIQFCEKFILIATNNAIESFWCNWEVGIGDVHKYKDHIAILPIKESSQRPDQYEGNEYLNLYSSIEYFNGSTNYSNGQVIEAGYYVRTPMSVSHSIEPFVDWLNKRR
jgi:hypothetical protein